MSQSKYVVTVDEGETKIDLEIDKPKIKAKRKKGMFGSLMSKALDGAKQVKSTVTTTAAKTFDSAKQATTTATKLAGQIYNEVSYVGKFMGEGQKDSK